MYKLNNYIISKNKSVKDALKLIDKNGEKTCFVIDDKKKLIGSVTDGDIRRKILKKKENLNQKIHKFCNKKTTFFFQDQIKLKKIKSVFIKKRIEIIPILDKSKKIIDIKLRSEIFDKTKKIKKKKNKSLSKVNVVVMAGGKGQRLDPITRIFPKPLVPIKDKTAIENILDSFLHYGAKKFFFTLNFKSDLIKAYFNNKPKMRNKITYINEKTPLGTVGGLRNLKGKISKNFILSNCDVIFDFNYENMIKHHIKSKNDLTLITSNQSSLIPYGVCEVNKKDELIKIIEKPKYNYLITTGLYVLNSKILKFIAKNKVLNMNNLIEILKKNNFKIGTFKISQKNWYDIGQLHEYKKKLELLSV